jgi:hypothetical protein
MEELEQESIVAMQGNESAFALPTYQHMLMHQFVDGPAQGTDADLHGTGNLRFVGQGMARPAAAGLDCTLQLLLDLAIQRSAAGIRQRRNFHRFDFHIAHQFSPPGTFNHVI